jgi:hypothetical protein
LLHLIMPFAPQMSFSRLAEPAGSPATARTSPTTETGGPLGKHSIEQFPQGSFAFVLPRSGERTNI